MTKIKNELEIIKPNYYAVIPSIVRYDKSLKSSEKLLYGEISALTNVYGYCTASNEYFSKLYDVDKNTISKWINKLKNKHYIKIEIVNNYQRKIFINSNTNNEKLSVEKKQIIDKIFDMI